MASKKTVQLPEKRSQSIIELAMTFVLMAGYKVYQFFSFWQALLVFCIFTYKEMWLGVISFLFPIPKKNLMYDVAVVVGSNDGIGKELALRLARCNATVVCIDSLAPEQETTCKQIKKEGKHALYHECDITVQSKVDETIEMIRKEAGDITMFFYCLLPYYTNSSKTSSITKSFDDLVGSQLYFLENLLPHMKEKRKGHLIFLKSVASLRGFSDQLPRTASQFAVHGLYESVEDELRVSNLDSVVKTTLVHIYPFIVTENRYASSRLFVPKFSGTMDASKAAASIIEGVRKNKSEISLPKHYLLFSRILNFYPRGITLLLRDFLDS